MKKVGLTLMLLAALFVLPLHAADDTAKVGDATALTPEIAQQPASNSAAVATLLRAVAQLIDDKSNQKLVTTANHLGPVPAGEQRLTRVVQLQHVPVDAVVNALAEYLEKEAQVRASAHENDAQRVSTRDPLLLPEADANRIIVSGTPKHVCEISELIAKLDIQPPVVVLHLAVAERVRDGQADVASTHEAPDREKHGGAWFDWAEKRRVIKIVSRPQLMTVNNQSALIELGAPMKRDASGGQTGTGLSIGATSRVTDTNSVVVEISAARSSSIVLPSHRVRAVKTRVLSEATVAADNGRTVVVDGLVLGADDPELIIAVTPHIFR